MRTGGDLADGAAAHDPEPGLPGHLVHAAALLPRTSDPRSARILPEPHQVSGHLPVGQQRPAAQAGKSFDYILYISDTYACLC